MRTNNSDLILFKLMIENGYNLTLEGVSLLVSLLFIIGLGFFVVVNTT